MGDMDTVERLKGVLRDALNIGARAHALSPSSRLLGTIPEFDSMAVVTVLTMIEEDFDITFDDDEVSAELFETLGSLAEFVERKKAG
jgi:acyl carrier protein